MTPSASLRSAAPPRGRLWLCRKLYRYRKKLAIGRRDLVVAALQRRGFAYPTIKEAIRRVEEE